MGQISEKWGLELKGSEADLDEWRKQLPQPYDPFLEEVKDERGDYLALRTSAFNGLATLDEVHRAARLFFDTLSATMSRTGNAGAVNRGAVVEFVADGPARKHHYIEVEGVTAHLRFGNVEITLRDAYGNVIASPQTPSKAQLWMRVATLEPEIGSALRYLEGEASWIELYKAYEALRSRHRDLVPKSEIIRFTQTANAKGRHHPNKTNTLPKRPMQLPEAHAFIKQWVSSAIERILDN